MKVFLESYGCTMNRGEAEEFADMALRQGHSMVTEEADADVLVMFTCGVIKTTENHMLKRVGQLSKYQDKMIIVCGCLGMINPQGIMQASPRAMIFGPTEHLLALKRMRQSPGAGADGREKHARIGMLPISTGCFGTCSYCITRKARGELVSRRPEEVKSHLEELVSGGCAEVQVCAQDTAAWGEDTGSDLGALLEDLQAVKGDFMMRIGMMNPAGARRHLDDIIEAYGLSKVFKFLHLPVQSGSDEVLKAMNRNYIVQDFLELVNAFRSGFPDLSLSTDIIVGFPGETDQDFEASLELVKRIGPDIINITRFSPRPGTPAAVMGDRVPGWAAKARSRTLTDLRFEITGDRYSEMNGQEVKALAVEYRVQGSTFLRTRNYKPVVVEGELDLGRWYELRIIGAARTHLVGCINQNV